MYPLTCDLNRFCFVCNVFDAESPNSKKWLKQKKLGTNNYQKTAIFKKLDVSLWKWWRHVGTRAIISSRAHWNRKVFFDVGGVWKWTSKRGKKIDTHPLHIQYPHLKTNVHHSTPRQRSHIIIIYSSSSTLSLLVWDKGHMHHRFPTKLHTTCPWRCRRFKMRLCLTSDWSGVWRQVLSRPLATSDRHGRSSSAGKPKACNLSSILLEAWVLETFLDVTKSTLNLHTNYLCYKV